MGPAVAIAFPRSPMSMAYTGVGPCRAFEGALHPRPRHPGQGPYRAPLRGQMGTAGAEAARVRAGSARDLQMLAGGRQETLLRGQILQFVPDDAVLRAQAAQLSDIPIYIAGRQRVWSCGSAGELCDGLHAHPFTSPKYLREFLLPHVEQGLKKSGRARKDFTISTSAIRDRRAQSRRRSSAPKPVSASRSHSMPRPAPTRSCSIPTAGRDVAPKLNEMAAKGDWAEHAEADHRRDARRLCGDRDLRQYRRKDQANAMMACSIASTFTFRTRRHSTTRRGADSASSSTPEADTRRPMDRVRARPGCVP